MYKNNIYKNKYSRISNLIFKFLIIWYWEYQWNEIKI